MRRSVLVLFVLSIHAFLFNNTLASPIGNTEKAVTDTLPSNPIVLSQSAASQYIIDLLEKENLWRPENGHKLKLSLERLVRQYQEPFDTVRQRLAGFNYDDIELRLTYIRKSDTIPVRWLNESKFIIDTFALQKEPLITRQTVVTNAIDPEALTQIVDRQELKLLFDSLMQHRDTILEVFIDTLYLKSKQVQIHRLIDENIIPPLLPSGSRKTARLLTDGSRIVVSESTRAIIANRESPFYIVPGEKMADSLRIAVNTLLNYTESRDSVLLLISSIDGERTPFWLNTNDDDLYRFWLKNEASDSLTIWIGNPSKYELTLMMEENVNVERRGKKAADDISLFTLTPQRTLARLAPLKEIPVYWKYGMENSFSMNGIYFSNWVKGGEPSLITMLDTRVNARYTNTERKSQWTNSGRLRYGSIITEDHGYRTNTDNLEFNSQYNITMREKIDFSSSFYGKTQIAHGFRYPNDTDVVSKFLNPGTFTVGVGVEYKPFSKTRINFSPLSYRNTFVLDTARINQKLHGIDLDKRARQEMGGQLVVVNSFSFRESLTVSNTARLFSGYLDKPQNIDVDWEISLDKRINWFFLIRLNFHMIYDDDIRFAVDRQEPDGTTKTIMVPKLQLKQLLGLTLSFKI